MLNQFGIPSLRRSTLIRLPFLLRNKDRCNSIDSPFPIPIRIPDPFFNPKQRRQSFDILRRIGLRARQELLDAPFRYQHLSERFWRIRDRRGERLHRAGVRVRYAQLFEVIQAFLMRSARHDRRCARACETAVSERQGA